jgi:hypothetical protein
MLSIPHEQDLVAPGSQHVCNKFSGNYVIVGNENLHA